MTDTGKIKACREVWFSHQANCKACQVFDFAQCPNLGAEFHEVCAAITANPACETVEGLPKENDNVTLENS